GVALLSKSADAVGVTVVLATVVTKGEAVGVGVSTVGNTEADRVGVAVGVGGQPRNAALTARTRSSTVTRPSALESAATQLLSDACASAMRTALTSSSIVPTPFPLQSPGHAADADELNQRNSPPTSASTRHIDITLLKIGPQS